MPRTAAVPTPPELARRMAATLLAAGGRRPVLDPACGAGALLAAARALAPDVPLVGIERDPELAALARSRLPGATILCADALDPATDWTGGAGPLGAGAVLANPPWSSWSGRGAAPRALGARAARGARAPLAGWPSAHGAFLERIARHVGPSRAPAVVALPASVAELERYSVLRRAVTSHAELAGEPWELGEDAFPGVTQPAVVVELRGLGRDRAGSPVAWTAPSGDGLDRALLERLGELPRLAPRTFADPGVHTGNAAAELVFERGAGPEAGTLAPLRAGRDLAAFRLGPPRLSVRTDLAPDGARRFRVPPLERMRAFPILLRQTASRPVAALHAPPGHFRNSLLACREVPGLDAAFVAAVLNSPVAAAWHRLSFRDGRQRAFPQVKVAHLATQPFPIAARADDPALHDEVARLARALGGEGRDDQAFARGVQEVGALVLRAFGLPEDLERRALELARTDPRSPRVATAGGAR